MPRKPETIEDQTRDSDIIFNQIKAAKFDSFKQAQEAIFKLYIPDMSISRSGISHALKRIERFYKENPCQKN